MILTKPKTKFVYDPECLIEIRIRKSWLTKMDKIRKPYKLSRQKICGQIFRWALEIEDKKK